MSTDMLEMVEVGLDQARFKAATPTTTERTLEFYAAAFSATPDKNGDIIDPRAFDDWLQRFYAAGQALRISFNHAAAQDSSSGDPTNTIGYAPADPEHVWVDGYGLRVKAFLDTSTEKGKAVEWQVEHKLLTGASLALVAEKSGVVKRPGGYLIKRVRDVREAGLVPNPANQDAVLLWLKSEGMLEQRTELPYMTVAEFRQVVMKAVDSAAWDGNEAMGMCSSAADYRQICAGEHTTGEPDQRQHWALPHHYLGKGPNEAGVRAALSRVPQTQDITDAERESAQSHLEAHMREINPESQASADEEVMTKHAASPSYLQQAHDALTRAGAKCATEEIITKSEDTDPTPQPDPIVEATEAVEKLKEAQPASIAGDEVLARNRKFRIIETSLP